MRLSDQNGRRKKKRLHKALIVCGAILAAVIGYALTVRIAGFGMDCMIKTLTAPECPGCGLSRAAAAILRLDPAAAFSYNAIRPLIWLADFGQAFPYRRIM